MPLERLKRRDFIALFGGAAVSWPLAARAQQGERVRRIGVMTNLAEDDPETRLRLGAFLQGLQQLGWSEGRNLRLDYRWGVGDTDSHRNNARELVALNADVILAHGSTIMGPLQRATRRVPIVFVSVADPVAGGFAASLARPGGNATGFTSFEYGQSGKWLELLKEIAPGATRAAVFRDPANPSRIGQFAVLQAMAPLLGMEVIPVNVRSAPEIERTVTAFARAANGGLIVTGGQASVHRALIFELAARHRLPAVYPYRFYVDRGGLVSYGPDLPGLFRQSAGYVDRILKGEKPADLPVQAPTKYELVLNLKTAKALGLDVPDTVLARADEVIE